MVIGITGSIETDNLDKLMAAYNECPDKMEIYLNCENGGDPDIAEAIIHIVNKNKEKTTIIGYGRLFSAAFDLFYKTTCNRLLLPGSIGMVHLSRVEISSLSVANETDKSEANIYKKWFNEDKKSRLKFYEELGLGKTYISKIKKGQDVYLQYDKLLELMNGKFS